MLALAVVAGLAWGIVALTAPDARAPRTRPERLLNSSKAQILAVEVVDPATGRRVAAASDQLRTLAADLTPLLAIRALPTVRSDYGLDAPFARVEARTAKGALPALLLGGTNFDGTGYYARIEGRRGAALVLVRIGDTAKSVLAASPQRA
ncbi:MAG TPA: hypothetical protein VMZ22_04115 [Acidimicrobiales bacterium]|nr:hypothetical protein [Acidimicrobiales bacterium]